MKKSKNNKNLLKLHLASCLIAFACLFSASLKSTQAQIVTFAQITEKNGTNDYVFTNNNAVPLDGINGFNSPNFGTISGGVPVDFKYFLVTGLHSDLQGFQNARVFMNATTSASATSNLNALTQSFNFSGNTIQIIRDTAASVGNGTRRNLLTVTFSPIGSASPSINGTDGGNSATFSATTPDHVVTFTSDFLTFSNSTERNFAFSFSSVTPALSIGAGNFLRSFAAAGTGTFASNPAPIALAPTVASVSVSGRVLTADGRGLRNAQVTITEADGSSRTVLTGNFGQFSFTNLTAGQTVVLSAHSKRYGFSPQIITLTEDLNEIEFIAKL
jgi:hypothetical protein